MKEIMDGDIDKLLLDQRGKIIKKEDAESGNSGLDDKPPGWMGVSGYGMVLPPDFIKASQEEASQVFFSKNRPAHIYLNREANAGITCQTIRTADMGERLSPDQNRLERDRLSPDQNRLEQDKLSPDQNHLEQDRLSPDQNRLEQDRLSSDPDRLEQEREEIRRVLKGADGNLVFYDQGSLAGQVPALWFDYKSFAIDERVYNLVFLFFAGTDLVMGTFYCVFKDYDKWRPQIFDMLLTIEVQEVQAHEGV